MQCSACMLSWLPHSNNPPVEMLAVRKTIHLKSDVAIGPGNLSVHTTNEEQGDESYIAIVHSESLELAILDKRKNVMQQDFFGFEDLKALNEPTEMQVIWCVDEPSLIVVHTNQLIIIKFDDANRAWSIDESKVMDQHCWINALASSPGHIYIGHSEGIAEVETSKLETRTKLGQFTTSALAISGDYMAVSHEEGGITLFWGGPTKWSQTQAVRDEKYCTSLLLCNVLVAACSSGAIRIYSLPSMDCLSETPAHIRWIVRVLPFHCGFLSASEDGFIHLWRIDDDKLSIEFVDSLKMDDCLLTGAASVSAEGVLVTAYDRSHIYWVTMIDDSGTKSNDIDYEDPNLGKLFE